MPGNLEENWSVESHLQKAMVARCPSQSASHVPWSQVVLTGPASLNLRPTTRASLDLADHQAWAQLNQQKVLWGRCQQEAQLQDLCLSCAPSRRENLIGRASSSATHTGVSAYDFNRAKVAAEG